MDFEEMFARLDEGCIEPCTATDEEYESAIRRRNNDSLSGEHSDEEDISFIYDIARRAGITPDRLADMIETENNWISIPTKSGVDTANTIQRLLLFVFSNTETKVKTNLGAYKNSGTVSITGDCMYFNKIGVKVLQEVLKNTNGLSISISSSGDAFAEFEIKY